MLRSINLGSTRNSIKALLQKAGKSDNEHTYGIILYELSNYAFTPLSSNLQKNSCHLKILNLKVWRYLSCGSLNLPPEKNKKKY